MDDLLTFVRGQARSDRLFPVNSEYVDLFWLPVLGPSSVAMLRLLDRQLGSPGSDARLTLAALGLQLGLRGDGRHSPVQRTLIRLHQFHVLTEVDGAHVVPWRMPWLSTRQVARLPLFLGELHQWWTGAEIDQTTGVPA